MEEANEVTPKVLIGVPILMWTHEFALSFLNFWTDLMTFNYKGKHLHVGYRFMYRRPVHMAEEELADFAVQTGCTHLLLMDDDIYDVTSKDLVALLEADKDVVGGIMHTSKFPYAMCAFRRYNLETTVAEQPILRTPTRLYEIPPDQRVGVQPADLIPFGFTLIKTSIFRKIPRPWFKCDNQAPTDSWFMDSILEAGVKPYAHFGVWLNHAGVTARNKDLKVQLGLLDAQGNGKGQVIQISKEDMDRHMAIMAVRMQEAEEQRRKQEAQSQPFFSLPEKEGAIGLKVEKESTNASTEKLY